MALTDADVRHVARLARLALDDDELARARSELEAILEHVSAISRLDLAGVPPTTHPLAFVNVLSPDEPRASVSQADALRNAPDAAHGGFRVPPIGA